MPKFGDRRGDLRITPFRAAAWGLVAGLDPVPAETVDLLESSAGRRSGPRSDSAWAAEPAARQQEVSPHRQAWAAAHRTGRIFLFWPSDSYPTPKRSRAGVDNPGTHAGGAGSRSGKAARRNAGHSRRHHPGNTRAADRRGRFPVAHWPAPAWRVPAPPGRGALSRLYLPTSIERRLSLGSDAETSQLSRKPGSVAAILAARPAHPAGHA